MHIFFSGIGGTGVGPLALIAHQAGYDVSGSDKQDSNYIKYLREHGITDIHIGQSIEQIEAVHAKKPIDWLVYSSAVSIEQHDAPELRFCRAEHIRTSKRDIFLNVILEHKQLKLIAVAGTHGKTTTTAMAIWLLQQVGIPISYSVGAKISFGDMGHYDPASQYFVYEADEFDHNFLSFNPYVSIITGIDWDHHDIYPTRESYQDAFKMFLDQSSAALLWHDDAELLGLDVPPAAASLASDKYLVLDKFNPLIRQQINLPGVVNRQDAWEVAMALQPLIGLPLEQLLPILNAFPGVSRRFEQVAPHLYSDYAHTPPKIRGTLDTAREVAKGNFIVIYEGLHNTRQHFIKDELKTLFDGVVELYIVPTYLAREDKNLAVWTPEDLKNLMSETTKAKTTASQLDDKLKLAIQKHLAIGEVVVCISAGGGGSLDEWIRKEFVGVK